MVNCLICKKEIIDKPIERRVFIDYENTDIVDPKVNEEKHFFFSNEHDYIDQILTDLPFFGGKLTDTIPHVIKEHNCEIEILETVVNTREFKSIWTEIGLRPYWHSRKNTHQYTVTPPIHN